VCDAIHFRANQREVFLRLERRPILPCYHGREEDIRLYSGFSRPLNPDTELTRCKVGFVSARGIWPVASGIGLFEKEARQRAYSGHLLSEFSSESGTRSGFYRRPAARRASAFPVPRQTNSSVTNTEEFLQVPPQKRPLALEA
jgi:hypothetical protein